MTLILFHHLFGWASTLSMLLAACLRESQLREYDDETICRIRAVNKYRYDRWKEKASRFSYFLLSMNIKNVTFSHFINVSGLGNVTHNEVLWLKSRHDKSTIYLDDAQGRT